MNREPLASCICGEHFECPDGWHYGDDLPCSCTADCALFEDDDLSLLDVEVPVRPFINVTPDRRFL